MHELMNPMVLLPAGKSVRGRSAPEEQSRAALQAKIVSSSAAATQAVCKVTQRLLLNVPMVKSC